MPNVRHQAPLTSRRDRRSDATTDCFSSTTHGGRQRERDVEVDRQRRTKSGMPTTQRERDGGARAPGDGEDDPRPEQRDAQPEHDEEHQDGDADQGGQPGPGLRPRPARRRCPDRAPRGSATTVSMPVSSRVATSVIDELGRRGRERARWQRR